PGVVDRWPGEKRLEAGFETYPGLAAFLKAQIAFNAGRFDEAAAAIPEAAAPPQVALAQLGLQAAAEEKLGRFDQAIKLRREVIERGSEFWPLAEYEEESADELPLKHYQRLIEDGAFKENNDYYPLPLERLELGLLKTYLLAGRRVELLRLEPKT